MPSTGHQPTPQPLDALNALDASSVLDALPPTHAQAVRRLVRERDTLFVLQEALVDVERASTLEERLRVLVAAIQKIGFGRVVVTLRDASLEQRLLVCGGLTPEEERELREHPASGAVWRRRLDSLERFRVSQSYYLDARDEWIAKEFHGGLPSRLEAGGAPDWTPRDALLVPLRATDGRVLATLVLDDPAERARPSLTQVRTVELFGQQVAYWIEQAQLVELAQRRADRLQRLHGIGSILGRSLDEHEIIRELARQVGRILPCDGIVVAHPDGEAGTVTTGLRLVRGIERPRAPTALGYGPVGEVARTGRAVRLEHYDPQRVALAAKDDLVGDGGPALSVMAVPMLLGVQLIGVLAVYSAQPAAYAVEDEEVLHTVAGQAATAITNARLYTESQRERRQTEALADVMRAVSGSLRLNEVMQLILRHAISLLRSEGAAVAMRRADGAALEFVAGGGTGERLVGLSLPYPNSLAGRAIRDVAYVVSNDVGRDPDAHASVRAAADVRQLIHVPLVTAEGAIGVLTVVNREDDFTDADARVLQRLADQVAVAIVNARLFEEAAAATREWSIAFDAIASGLVVLDAEGRVRRSNARAAQLVGLEGVDALLGRPFHEAVLGHDTPCEHCVHVRAIERKEVARGTHHLERRGRIFDLVAAPHPSGGAVVTFDDVTSHHTLAERYRRVLETSNDAIVITDPQRRIVYANPAAMELFGRPDTLVGLPVSETVAPEGRDEVRAHESAAFEGEAQRYETTILRATGERRAVAVSTAPLREIGRITGIVASLRDITAERRARDAVAQSEARYRNLFETAGDAIYTLDARGAFTSANRAACDLIGRPREELLGRSTMPFVHPDDRDVIRTHFLTALAGQSRRYDCRLMTAAGAIRQLSVTNTPIRHGAEVIGVLGIARDVTEARARAAALARSEARYTHLVEAAPDAIFTLDEEGLFTAVNRSLELAVGRPRESLLGSSFLELVDPRDRIATWDLFVDTMRGDHRRADFRYLGADGEPRAGAILTAPVEEDGRITGALGIVRDVTDEKRLLDQLLQQERLAAIGQLVSGVTHELNNPLAGVLAHAQLLLAAPPADPEQRRAAEVIHHEAKRAAKIVSSLLTFARRTQPERRETDLNQVVSDALELRRYALRVQQVEVETSLAAELPRTWADPLQLQQVFLNLIANAEQALVEWGGERRLGVRTRCVGGVLEVCVSDTGPGIPPERLDRIFDPFYTTKPVGQGTGLGLSIADGIVHEHGGQLTAESTPGAGVTFTVTLPVTAVPPRAATPAAGAPADAAPTRAVLVVDDEPSIRTALRTFLRSLGHSVDVAATGREALARLERTRYDAVLLDLRMPDMAGDAVYQEIARRDPAQAACVVFLTGDVHGEAASGFVASTGRPCVCKPFVLDDLAAVLFGQPTL